MCVNGTTAVLYLCIIMWNVLCHMLLIFVQLENRVKHFSWLWMIYFENPVNKKAYKQLQLKKVWINLCVLTIKVILYKISSSTGGTLLSRGGRSIPRTLEGSSHSPWWCIGQEHENGKNIICISTLYLKNKSIYYFDYEAPSPLNNQYTW